MGRLIGLGVGALGAYGVVSALLDGNDAPVPEADHAMARANAERTLERIDWNKPIIAIDVPGTKVGFPKELADGLQRQAGAERVNATWLEYPAAATGMVESVALGKQTLRLVLDEIRRRDPNGVRYHVALQGESQGAWVINDVLAEDPYRDTVDRVALYGLPGDATHDGALAGDERVRITNHPFDPIWWPHLGPANIGARAPGFAIGRDRSDIPAAALMTVLNPIHAVVFGVGELIGRLSGDYGNHPHIYTEHYAGDGARWLLGGVPARPS